MPKIIKICGLAVGMAIGAAAQAVAGPVTPPADATRAFTVRVTGAGDRPMILIPGLLSSGEVWEDVVEHFSSRYRLHVLTLAGFAGVPAVEGPLLPRVRDELIDYIRQNRLDRPVLVGHSLGAFLAFWVAVTAPDVAGPIVAVDGVPFLPALMNPSTTVVGAEPMAQQMRTLYRSMTAEQLEMQTRMVLGHMITGEAAAARATAWARRSDGRSAGQALYELMTTDLRESSARISSELLLIAAVKSVASMPDQLDATLRGYEAQVARVPHHRVVAAKEALHFVMLDDPRFLLSAMDEFLSRRPAAPPAGQ